MKEYLKTLLPLIAGFYEVQLNGERLQYWEHRSNYVYFGNDNRLHILTPTEYAKNRRVKHPVGYDWKNIVEDLKETTMDQNIPKILFAYVFGFHVDRMVSLNIKNKVITIMMKSHLEITLFKSLTSLKWDKGNIPECIDFNSIN